MEPGYGRPKTTDGRFLDHENDERHEKRTAGKNCLRHPCLSVCIRGQVAAVVFVSFAVFVVKRQASVACRLSRFEFHGVLWSLVLGACLYGAWCREGPAMVGISLREMNPLAEREVYRTRDLRPWLLAGFRTLNF